MLIDELSRATGLGFLMSQAPMLLFLMLYYKEPQATLYTVRMTNITSEEIAVQSDSYGVSVGYFVASALGVVFSFMTAQLQENQVIDHMVEFSDELMSTFHSWNAVMWLLVLAVHGLLVAQICSPVDTYFLVLCVVGITYAVQCMCAPGRRKSDSLALIVFMLVAGAVYSEMHVKHGLRLLAWTALAMADILLVVGHAYDSQSNMETVANCRVVYCSFAMVLLLLLYCV
jgi:hypothetical protein